MNERKLKPGQIITLDNIDKLNSYALLGKIIIFTIIHSFIIINVNMIIVTQPELMSSGFEDDYMCKILFNNLVILIFPSLIMLKLFKPLLIL